MRRRPRTTLGIFFDFFVLFALAACGGAPNDAGVTARSPAESGAAQSQPVVSVATKDRQVKVVSSRGVDADGNGRADVYLLDQTWRLLLWRMNGPAVVAQHDLGAVGRDWRIVDASGDYDGDGRTDILWRHQDGSLSIWLMDGAQRMAVAFFSGVDAAWQVADGRGDYDGDGRSDILWRHASGTVAIWSMNGTEIASSAFPATVPAEWTIVDGGGDYDGDGRSDVLWRRTDGVMATWSLQGGQISATRFLTGVSLDWVMVDASGDYDGDGTSDVLWRHVPSGQVFTWLMRAGSIRTLVELGHAESAWSVLDASSDFDGDGRSDILWRHRQSGLVLLWRVAGTALAGFDTVRAVDAGIAVGVGSGVMTPSIPDTPLADPTGGSAAVCADPDRLRIGKRWNLYCGEIPDLTSIEALPVPDGSGDVVRVTFKPLNDWFRTTVRMDGLSDLISREFSQTTRYSSRATYDYVPPIRFRYDLRTGESYVQTVRMRGGFEGRPDLQVDQSITRTTRFVGVELVTVPAGTFCACRFDTLEDGASSWLAVGTGVLLQSIRDREVKRLQRGEIDGRPIAQ